MSGLRSGKWPFTKKKEQSARTNSEDNSHHNNNMNSNNVTTTIGGNKTTSMVFNIVVQSSDPIPNETWQEISKSESSNGNPDSAINLIRLSNEDTYVPYYEQPIQSSDNFRPSDVIRSRVFPRNFRVNSENDDQVRGQHVPESEEEKSSLEGSSTPPSEDALVGSDSDDRGEMHDVVSNIPRQDKPVPALIQCKELKLGRYLPKETEDYIKRYMGTRLFDSSRIIPLYYPSPDTPRPETWAKNVCMGDVGFFNPLGGFTTLFNIFETKSANISLGYRPPASFRPFYLPLSMISAEEDRREPPEHHWKTYGLQADNVIIDEAAPSIAPSIVLWVPPKFDAADYSAIYMENGYARISMQQHRQMEVLQYLRDEHPLWQSHFDQNCPIQFRDLSLAVILEVYRAETWTFATGTKRFLETKKDPLTLKQLPMHHNLSRYIWKTKDRSVRCEYGPKKLQMDQLEQYISEESMRSNLDDEDCRRIREHHCVGVRACVVTKPRSRIGTSISSLTSSKSTLRSRLQLHMSMPTIHRP